MTRSSRSPEKRGNLTVTSAMRAKVPSTPSMMRASPSQAKTSSQAPAIAARVASSAQTTPRAVKRWTRAAGQAMRIHPPRIQVAMARTNTKERRSAPLACPHIRRWQSETMLDGAANLHVAGFGLVLRQALGFGCAVEQLQPEVELGQNADLAEPGDPHLGPGALADAELGDLQVEALPRREGLRRFHGGYGRRRLFPGGGRRPL